MIRIVLAAALIGVIPALPAIAMPPMATPPVEAVFGDAVFGDEARDHAAILAMTGVFKVTFDMRETTPLVAGYVPYPAKLLEGHEVVRAIVDVPGRIVLQHMLVVKDEKDQAIVVKHWRQDWTWQPASVLVYTAPGRWAIRPVPPADRIGTWSQTVWQTDDSPRYGGVGRWRYDNGATRWTSDETRRPLARRDATRHPPYDHYLGLNHHVLTPTGWVQEQENAKIGTRDGKSVTFVREYIVNTYARDDAFPAMAADAYWSKSKDYWAAVRADWQAIIAKNKGLHLAEDAENGSVTGHALMKIADDVAAGAAKPDAASARAAALIAAATSP